MANKGSISFDLTAQITGYEASLAKLKAELAKLDPGAAISKNLSHAITAASNQVKGLGKNLVKSISSENELNTLVDKLNKVTESIQNIGTTMQTVSKSDINLTSFSAIFDGLQNQITALTNELNTKLNTGFTDFIKNSEGLSQLFEKLNIDVDNKSIGQIFEEYAKKAEEAQARVEESSKALQAAENALTREQNKLTDLKNDPLNNQKQLTEQLNALFEKSKTATTFPQTIIDNIKHGLEITVADDSLREKILQNFLGGLTPENITKRITELKNAVQQEAKFINTEDLYKKLFGDLSAKNSAAITAKIASQTGFGKVGPIEDEVNQIVDSISHRLTATQIGNIRTLLSENDIQGALTATIEAIRKAYGKLQGEITHQQKNVLEEQQKTNTAKAAKVTAEKEQQVISDNTATLEQAVETLKQENSDLRDRIAALEQQKDVEKEKIASGIRDTGKTTNIDTSKWVIAAEDVEKYSKQLEKVQNQEKLIGNISGLLTRWFSIYGVVNMVRSAITSMISTVKELDKTITEIAIVTDMSSSNLWGQMGSYTDIAKEYATSISGVYKVSQLYYQQGLQTADVMALTTETLKMARISGLDYSEATNYMTNAVRSFKMEMSDASRVVDVYSALAASSATSVSELATAMSKTASSAQAVGASFENTTAMMAVMIEATRESATNIGSAMKSIISRYGELKTDPSKLVDSEGEVLSLNKVDTALQSVGISLHDAQGQFREFDDVIMELADSWDSIDKNTQRYIATVMAGNRQQSRFLALVSSGERLKELSEEAANSEDAAQLQYLKTLDSIDAKTQQLQTSLQSLYIDSGLEQSYKALLDFGKNIIDQYASMPRIFGAAIPALVKFGSQFFTLATVARQAFTLIKHHLRQSSLEATAVLKVAHSEQLSEEEKAAYERSAAYQNGLNQMIKAERNAQQELNNIASNGGQERVTRTQRYAQQRAAKNQTKWQVGGMIASVAGLAGSLWAANIREEDAAKSGHVEIGSSILQGVGNALAMPGTLGMKIAAGLMTAIPGIISGLTTIFETVEEKIQKLQENLTTARNNTLQAKDELKTLTDYKKKYEEVYKARNQSNESYQEYLDLSNEIAAKYPELISGMDKEGNYIVSLTKQYDMLAQSKRDAYDKNLREEATAAYKLYNNKDYYTSLFTESSDDNKDVKAVIKNLKTGKATSLSTSVHRVVQRLDELSSVTSGTFGEQAQKAFDYSLKAWTASSTEKSISKGLFGTEDIDTLYKKLGLFSSGSKLEAVIKAFENNFDTSSQTLSGLKDFKLSPIFYQLQAFADIADYYSTWYENQMQPYYNAALQSAVSAQEDLTIDSFQYGWLQDKSKDFWEEYQKQIDEGILDFDTAFATYQIELEKYLSDQGEFKTDFTLYNGLTSSQKDYINEIYTNLNNYTELQLQELLKDYAQIFAYLKPKQESSSKAMVTRFSEEMKTLGLANYVEAITGWFGSDYLEDIAKSFDIINSNEKLTDTQKTSQIKALFGIYNAIASINDLNLKREILSKISDADLTSINGIATVIEALDLDAETGVGGALMTLLKLLQTSLPIEINSYIDSLTSSITDFSSALSSATSGMDYEKALEFTQKMGLSLSDLRLTNGKYYYDNLNKIKENLIKNNDILDTTLAGRISEIDTETLQFLANATDEQVSIYAENANLTQNQIQLDAVALWDYYKESYKKALEDNPNLLFKDFLLQQLDYYKYAEAQIQEVYIKNGQFEKANIDIDWSKVSAGDFSDIDSQYWDAVASHMEDNKTVLEAAIKSWSEKTATKVNVTSANKAALTALGERVSYSEDGETAIINAINMDYETLREILDNPDIEMSKSSRDALLESAVSKQQEELQYNILENAINNYQSMTEQQAERLRALGINTRLDEDTLTYSTSLEELQEYLNEVFSGQSIHFNQLKAKLEKTIRETSLDSVLLDITKNYNSLNEENIESLANALNSTYDNVEKLLHKNADGSYSISIATIQNIINEKNLTISSALQEQIASIIDDIVEGITGLTNITTQGTNSFADMQKYASKLQEAGFNANVNELFEWNETVNAFVLSQEGLLKEVMLAREKLADLSVDSFEYQNIQHIIDDTQRQFAEKIDFSAFLSAENREAGSIAYTTLQNALNDYNKFLAAIGQKLSLDIKDIINAFTEGDNRQDVIKIAEDIAKAGGKELSNGDIEAIYHAPITGYMEALEEFSSGVGSIISKQAAEILGYQGVTQLGNSGRYVVESAINLVDAYQALYDKLAQSGQATLTDLNTVMARKLEAKTGADVVSFLGSAADMTYTEFGEVLAQQNIALTEDLIKDLSSKNILEEIGGGKLRITNFAALARKFNWDTTSEEYISAFKSYNDAMIDLNNKTERNIAEEVSKLSDENLLHGGKINLTELWSKLYGKGSPIEAIRIGALNKQLKQNGAFLTDGILDIQDNANILGIMQSIYDAAESNELMLASDLQELADTINDILQSITDLISGGITGNLSNVQKDALSTKASNWLGITDLHFEKTAEGFKLAQNDAIRLYTTLQQIDRATATVTFKALQESLTQAGQDCQDMFSTLRAIKELEKQEIKNDDVRQRLQLYKEIAQTQMQDANTYKFMDQNLPDYLQGPVNFWDSLGKMYDSFEAAETSKYFDPQDFYNIVNTLNDMAAISGNIEFLGYTLDGSLETASQLIQQGFNALKYIDGQGAMIALDSIAIDFSGGAADMATNVDAGIQDLAQSQIDMLDGMIRVLETVVAMEKLGDITGNNDTIDIEDLYPNITWDNAKKQKINNQQVIDWINDTMLSADPNSDLGKALNSILVNGKSLHTWMHTAVNEGLTQADANTFSNIINSLYQMYQSGSYDLQNLMNSIQSVMATSGFQGEIQLDNVTYAVGYGVTLEKSSTDNTYKVNGQSFTDPQLALQAYALQNLPGADKNSLSRNGEIIDVKFGDFTLKASFNENAIEYDFNGYKGSTARKALYEYWQSIMDDQSEEGFAQFLKDHAPELLYAPEIQVDETKITQMSTTLRKQAADVLAKAWQGQELEEADLTTLANVGITVDNIDLQNPEALQQIGDLLGIDLETKSLILDTKITGQGSNILNQLDTGAPITGDLTINVLKGTDEVGIENGQIKALINGVEATKTADFKVTGLDEIWKELPLEKQEQLKALIDSIFAEKDGAFSKEQFLVDVKGILDSSITEEDLTGPEGKAAKALIDTLEAGKAAGFSDADLLGFVEQLINTEDEEGAFNHLATAYALFDTICALESQGITIDPEVKTLVTQLITDNNSDEKFQAGAKAIALLQEINAADGLDQSAKEALVANISTLIRAAAGADDAGQLIEAMNALAQCQKIIAQLANGEKTPIEGLTEIETIIDNALHFEKTAQIDVTPKYNWKSTVGEQYELGLMKGYTEEQAEIYGRLRAYANQFTGNNGILSIPDYIGYDDEIAELIAEAIEQEIDIPAALLEYYQGHIPEKPRISPTKDETDDEKQRTITAENRIRQDTSNAFEFWYKDLGSVGNEFFAQFASAEDAYNGFVNNIVNNNLSLTEGLQQAGLSVQQLLDLFQQTSEFNLDDDYTALEQLAISLQEELQSEEPFKLEIDSNDVQELQEDITDTQKQAEELDNTSVSPSADTSGIDELNRKLTLAGNKITNLNGLVIKPKGGVGLTRATGNVALAGGRNTLMGELGPELWVSNGHYYVAGQGGAEFVNLPDDAIVFNHKQTESLMKNGKAGRGKPVTNETKAISFAKGNIHGGPAQASAASALSALKQIRSMWQSLLGASMKDLASKGGGGGGGGGDKDVAGFIADVERWYNLLQDIAQLEKEINYEEALRAKIESDYNKNGKAYVESQITSLRAYEKQLTDEQELMRSQQAYFEYRRQELNSTNSPFSKFYEYDENGQIKFKNNGYAELAAIVEANQYGAAKMTPEEQYKTFLEYGIPEEYMMYSEGKEIKKEDYENEDEFFLARVNAVWDRMQSEQTEMQELKDSIDDHALKSLELEKSRNELLQSMRDEMKDMEDQVLTAIEEMRERIIKEAEDTRDAYKDTNQEFIDGLTKALDKERQMYENNQSNEELNRNKRQLAILQRSGGSASQIASLQQQIGQQEQDQYFTQQQQQIDAIQEASDLQIEKLDMQIDIMNEQLEFEKANGLLWNDVYAQLQKTPAELTDFISKNVSAYWAESPLTSNDSMQKLLFDTERYNTLRDKMSEVYNEDYFNQEAQTLQKALFGEDNVEWAAYSTAMQNAFGQQWLDLRDAMKKDFDQKIAATSDINKAGNLDKDFIDAANKANYGDKNKTETKATVEKPKDNGSGGGGGGNGAGNSSKTGKVILRYINGYSGKELCSPESKTYSAGTIVNAKTYVKKFTNFSFVGASPSQVTVLADQKVTIEYQYEPENIEDSSDPTSNHYGQFKSGGVVDYTGPAMVHGSPSDPEYMLSAPAFKAADQFMNNFLDHKATLAKITTLRDIYNDFALTSLTNTTSSNTAQAPVIIENATVEMNVQRLANDYDARRAGGEALDEILKIARKTTVSSVRR